ncbi:MAG: NRDE family protein [Bermanella sp.]
MCLLSFDFQPNSPIPLTLVANRDEFHQRPAAPAHFWQEHPHLLAGKDLTAGGTWLGVTKQGYFAALTNVRQLPAPYQGTISRGNLVLDFLIEEADPQSYLQRIQASALCYDGFNLVVGNRKSCWFYSNRQTQGPIELAPGLYGLSNASLDTPWPKLNAAKDSLQTWLSQPDSETDRLHALLRDPKTYPQALLPDTGIGEPWETLLSSAFIVSENYGTRASTGLIIADDSVHFQEASYDSNGETVHLETFDF